MKSKAQRKAIDKYEKTHLKRVVVKFQNEYYYGELLPVVEASGETVGGYIKKAIAERMERDVAKT